MCFFFSFLPATIWIVLGYFILFASTKSQGAIQMFGRVLAIWVFIIAAFFPVMGAYVTFAGLCPLEAMLQAVQSG
jgi:hypothetical protein